MPRGDRTGPAGEGPMTGRGLGYCGDYNHPGYMTPGFGRGFGRGWWGRGFGRGLGRSWGRGWYWPYPLSREQEKEILAEEKEMVKKEVDSLSKEIKAIDDRIKEIEAKKK